MKLPSRTEQFIRNGAQEGERNQELFLAAQQIRDAGGTEAEAMAKLSPAAESSGLKESEIRAAITSAFRRSARQPITPHSYINPFKPLKIEIEPCPKPSDNSDDVRKFLLTAFKEGERICIVGAVGHEDGERPNGKGTIMTREEWLHKFHAGVELPDAYVGAYVCINPVGESRKAEDVKDFRHALIEFDSGTMEEQWAIVNTLELPCSVIIHSGHRSVHAWVKVDAKNAQEYAERVAYLYSKMAQFDIDPKNKDASRLSRLPGAPRKLKNRHQALLASNTGRSGWSEWKAHMETMNLPQPTPWDDILNFDAGSDNDCLLGNRWLCKGGSCLWVGGSGLGKSTLCLQAMMTWALGRSFLGISPKKPLRSLLIQAENDLGDVAEMAQGVLRHLKGTLNLNEDETKQILDNVVIVRDCTKTGPEFAKMAASLIGLHRPDLCWIDPLLSFMGGDALAQENMTMFLRHCLNPISVATGVTWMVMHHTPKPPKEGQGSTILYDLAYAGIGSSELTNWARAVVYLQAVKEGHFKLSFPKRGSRAAIPWPQADTDVHASKYATHVWLKHAEEWMAWEESNGPENTGRGRPEVTIERAIPDWPKGGGYGTCIDHIIASVACSKRKAQELFAVAKQDGTITKNGDGWDITQLS